MVLPYPSWSAGSKLKMRTMTWGKWGRLHSRRGSCMRGTPMGFRSIFSLGALLLALLLGACVSGDERLTHPSAQVVTPTPVAIATTTPAPTTEPSLEPVATPGPTGAPTPEQTPVPTPTPAPTIVPASALTPTPGPTATPGPVASLKVWRIGLLEDISSTNIWDILGPSGTASNLYVFKNRYPSLYTLSELHSNWVPSLAKGKPGDLSQEGDLWIRQVELKEGVQWSDGVEITAHDVAFTVNTALELGLPGDWAVLVDPASVEGAEAVDDYTVKFYFKAQPGLAHWEYGLSQTSIVAKHYWNPVVAEARTAGTIDEQRKALFSHIPVEEPTAGEMLFSKREPGVFVEMIRNPNYYWAGSTVKEYPNGAYVEEKPGAFRFQDYGEPEGEPSLTVTRGPGVDSVVFRVYEDQKAAVIGLRSDRIDYILAPQGIAPGLRKHLQGRNITTSENAANELHFLGFNLRRPPMDSKEFRQAVAVLIDKQFLTNVVLQRSALPTYSLVPEGNEFWWNPDVPTIGRELTRDQRIQLAMALLKKAGFTWDVQPRWNKDKLAVEPGAGLKMPDGQPVPEMELLALDADHDPVGALATIWIEGWLKEAGIPVRADLTSPGEIDRAHLEQDFHMSVLALKLSPYPRHLVDLFHSDEAVAGGQNLSGYQNSEFDKLAEAFLEETDLGRAQERAFELQKFIAEESSLVVLFSTPIVEAYRGDLVKWAFTRALDGMQNSFGSMNGPLSSTLIS